MKSFHDEAVVLKKKPLKEKDELIVFLTKYHGKMALYSYGSRDPKSRKAGVIELFNQVAFEARQGKSSLPVLQQVKLLQSRGFGMLKKEESLEKFYRAAEMVRITDAYLHESQIVQDVFDDLNQALDAISISFVGLVYKIRLLTDLGFLPDWKVCTACHERIQLQVELVFDQEHNGFAHRACFSLGKHVSSDLVKVMSFFQESSLQESIRVECGDDLVQDLQECLDLVRIEEDI